MSANASTGKRPEHPESSDSEENTAKRARTARPVRVDLDTKSDSGFDSGSDSDRTSDFSESDLDSNDGKRVPPEWLTTLVHQLIYVNELESDNPLVKIAELKQQMTHAIAKEACGQLTYDHCKRDFLPVISTVSSMISGMRGIVSRATIVDVAGSTLFERFMNMKGSDVPLPKEPKTYKPNPLPPVPPQKMKPAPPKKVHATSAPKAEKRFTHLPTNWETLIKQAGLRYGDRLCAIPAFVLSLFAHKTDMQMDPDKLKEIIGSRYTRIRESTQEGSDPSKSVLSGVFVSKGTVRMLQSVYLRRDMLDALHNDPSLGTRFLKACEGSSDYRLCSANRDGVYNWPQ